MACEAQPSRASSGLPLLSTRSPTDEGDGLLPQDVAGFRNEIGLDVPIEALRDYRRRRGSVDELLRYAEICRVARVMRPYLEALA